jgi:hypothetical protein
MCSGSSSKWWNSNSKTGSLSILKSSGKRFESLFTISVSSTMANSCFSCSAKTKKAWNQLMDWQYLWRADNFKSADALWSLINSLPNVLGPQSWKRQEMIIEEDTGTVHRPFFYQDLLKCIRLLLRHLPFKNHLVWAPKHEYANASPSERVYLEMCTGNCWWNEQAKLPPGATLVPRICGSDKTLLTTMAGNYSA